MSTSQPTKYDLCVIGCGPSGFAAAMRALDFGKHVCIIEGDEIGGAGVMWGALASKTMWELAKDVAVSAKVDRGYRASGLTVNYSAIKDTVMQAVKEKQYQMLSQIETFSPQRYDGPGSLTLKRGWASFCSKNDVQITYQNGNTENIASDHTIIATGSKPRQFPGIEFDHHRILSSDSILHMKDFPKRLIIIGAGIVGCEYATIFSNFSQTKVYLVDHQETVIPFEDDDISTFVNDCLTNNGVKIFHSAILKDIRKHEKYLEVVLDFSDGHAKVVEVDAVLISIGREPNLSCLCLDKVNITPDEQGRLPTTHQCRIKNDIYAVGDVTHLPALVNIAEMEARHAVTDIFDKAARPLNYTNMSTIMFFNPAVATIGMNEKACQKKNIPYRAAYYSNTLLPRAIAMRSLNGFVKLIVSDEDNPKILGMRAAGPQVSSTVMAIALFMEHTQDISELLKSVYPHPTMSEAIQGCVRLLLGKSKYKPSAFPDELKIWRWRPEPP